MNKLQAFFRLQNPVKTYAWGHRDQINQLIGRPDDGQPQAEVWMGAHPGSPSLALSDEGSAPRSLAELIEARPREMLGSFLCEQKIDTLPFLFKVLAAAKPLSIQCHPSLDVAKEGFAREDALGIPRDHDRRNYRDANHKPEIICAITEFWGLCGFRGPEAIREDFGSLAALAADAAAREFFASLAAPPATDSDAEWLRWLSTRVLTRGDWCAPVCAELVRLAAGLDGKRFECLLEAAAHYPGDTGLLFFLLLELVHLDPGQAQYIPAGVLHAYLRGFGVELMANSDNVLRGGLTPKHIDVAELLLNLDPAATGSRFNPDPAQTVIKYPAMTPEFDLARLYSPGKATRLTLPASAVPQIVLCMSGSASWESPTGERAVLAKGQSLFIRPLDVQLQVVFEGEVYIASVPLATDQDALYAGVDGGGTSTRVCLMDARGTVLGLGRSGPSSIDTVGMEQTAQSISEALDAALQSLAGRRSPIRAVVAGLGGIVSEADESLVAGLLARLPQLAPGASTKAVNDMKTALAGGTRLEPGIVCILGTGSVAYGRNAAGAEHKTGGWGWKEGDPGSSFDLGISAIRSLVRAGDGRSEHSEFTRVLERQLGLRDIADITTLLYQRNMSRTEIAALAPLVSEWADRGDPHARAIAARAAADTLEMIGVVFKRLFASGPEPVPLAIVGSLGNAPSWFRTRILEGLAEISPRLELRTDGLEPVFGAALWALQLCGLHRT